MAKAEPILQYRTSRPGSFHCSLCGNRQDEGAFVITGDIAALIDAFEEHAERFHPQGEDFSQAAARIVRDATGKI
jgi:hypothetical protein